MGLEHHLGMTCDPVCGLVQIPCIERNAFAAARALDADLYASFSDGHHRVSFDRVVEVMRQTGHDLPSLYKETSEEDWPKDLRVSSECSIVNIHQQSVTDTELWMLSFNHEKRLV